MRSGPKALRYLSAWLWIVAAAGVMVGLAPSGPPTRVLSALGWEPIEADEQGPPAPTRLGGAWLDAPLTNWNDRLKAVPASAPVPARATGATGAPGAPGATGAVEAPAKPSAPGPGAIGAGPIDARCKDQIRTANSSEDRLVTAAGWTLVGSRQTFNDVTLVTAMTGTDGMCRPVGYQAFVFVGGTFAGTLSPAPMDSRTDGMIDRIFLTTPDRVTAEFRRYKDSDPLCCPSGGSGVSYRVERKGRPLLVPDQATASPTSK